MTIASSASDRAASARIPWAALLAVAIVLGADGFGLRWFGPWQTIADQAGRYDANSVRKGLDFGIAHDRQQLAALRAAPPERRRAVVVGSSRVAAGFDDGRARDQLPSVHFGKVGHAGLDAFVMRSLADDLADHEPDVALFLLSEYDTHRPVRLEPMPGKSSADLGALRDVASLIGGDFYWQERQTVLRLATSGVLESYRYRRALARTELHRLREFPIPARLRARDRTREDFLAAPEHSPTTYWDAKRRAVPRLKRKEILAHFEGRPGKGDRGLSLIAETTVGDHARVNMALLERAFARLRERGVAVVIVEGPIHPAARISYSPETTREFREFGARLAREGAATFIPLSSMPPFPAEEFGDLLHLGDAGDIKLTDAIVRAVDQALGAPGTANP